MIFNAPEGIFGNPNAVTHCTSSDFALDQCPSNSQAGLDHHTMTSLVCLAPRRSLTLNPRTNQTALFAFIVPTLNIPIEIPVAVRTGRDYGLRFTVSDITQLTPLAGADLTFWGFPAEASHDTERFPKGAPANPPTAPGLTDTSCIGSRSRLERSRSPAHRQPDHLHRAPLTTTLEVQTYQDPEQPLNGKSELPGDDRMRLEVFNPVLYASPTTTETDAPSGLNIELSAPQFLGFAASPSRSSKSATVTLPPGSRSIPTPPTARPMCTEAQANFDSEGPAECPDQLQDRHLLDRHPGPTGRLEGAVYIGEPEARRSVPPVPDRLGLRDQRQAGRLVQTEPRNRSADGVLRKPAPGSLRRLPAAPLLL